MLMAGLALVAFTSCEQPKQAITANAVDTTLAPVDESSNSLVQEPAPETFSQELTSAFAAAFGGRLPPLSEALKITDTENNYTIRPFRLIPLGEPTALISEATNVADSHMDYGAIVISYVKRAEAFSPIRTWPAIDGGFGFGGPPTWNVRTDLFANPTVEIESGWAGQGCSTSEVSLIELTPEGPVDRGSVPISHSYEQDASNDYEATLSRSPDGEIIASYKGAITRTDIYNIDRSTQQLSTPAEKLPGC
jgi:hypothetical protein